LEIIRRNADKAFIIDALSGREFTYADFHRLALSFCLALKKKKLSRGDRIAVCLPNGAEFAALYFAAFYSGITLIPVNTNLNGREIEFIISSSRAKALIYSAVTRDYIAKFPAKESIELEAMLADKTAGTFEAFSGCTEDDVFAVMYTSGTTQLPKGVAHSIKGMSDNALDFIRMAGVSPQDRFYNLLSMAYMAGFYNLVLLPFLAEASIVIDEAFSPQSVLSFWKAPIKWRVNCLWLVPTILYMLLKLDRDNQGADYCRGQVKKIFAGTAPLAAKLRREFEAKYGVSVYENYGLSETLFISANSAAFAVVDASVGKLLPSCRLSIRDNSGRALSIGEEGEISVISTGLMRGYLNPDSGVLEPLDPAKEFATGDIGYLDDEGHLFITGRKKDLIIRGGINISPRAVENILSEHEAVEAAAVIGMQDAAYGESITAVVKLKEGYVFEEARPSLVEHCRRHLSAVQQPQMFFQIQDFPLTSTGKISKEKLKNILTEKLRV
jgi:long-chain acyl-CoA synthetase